MKYWLLPRMGTAKNTRGKYLIQYKAYTQSYRLAHFPLTALKSIAFAVPLPMSWSKSTTGPSQRIDVAAVTTHTMFMTAPTAAISMAVIPAVSAAASNAIALGGVAAGSMKA